MIPRKVFCRLLNTKADTSPTIYALSTKLGRSAIGVVRVSGSQSSYIFHRLTKEQLKLPQPRMASVRRLVSPQEPSLLLDEALVIYFKAPNTYTGEDILEFHLHGGTAISQSVLRSIGLLHQPDKGVHIRYAEQGEFLKRAFINGRADLTTLEGVREMIDAETETQRIAALASIKGDTKHVFSKWRDEIVHNVALLTTVIDFGEDHDLDEVAHLFDSVAENIKLLTADIEKYLHKVQRSEVLLRGIKILLLGPPNAGKSSLLNLLANQNMAIVSNKAGTTRDIIDVPMDINGYKIVVSDTAGIRKDALAESIELEGMNRAKLRSLGVDMVVVVLSLEQDPNELDPILLEHIKVLQSQKKHIDVVLNKCDLKEPSPQVLQEFATKLGVPSCSLAVVSCTENHGLSNLMTSLTKRFKEVSLTETTNPIVVSARIQDLLKNDVLYSFEQFHSWKEQDEVVLATESLRLAVDGIGKITGETIGVEEILGVVFSSFCIGK